MNTKRRLYNQIIESISVLVKNAINEAFNNDIFNQYDNEMSYKDDEESLLKDSYIINNIGYRIYNNSQVSKEEAKMYFDALPEEYEKILIKLKNAEIENKFLIAIYKVKNKSELKKIIKKYSKKKPSASLNWIDTSEIIDMSELFEKTKYNGDISKWDVSNVTNMSSMFYEALKFNQPIGNWDVSNVTNMSWMFDGASSFNQAIGDWNVSNVRNMSWMFDGASSFNQAIGDWNVNKVTNMSCMFFEAESFDQPIGDWNVSNVKNINLMFFNAKSFNLNLRNWKLNPIYSYHLFKNCPIKEEYKPNII